MKRSCLACLAGLLVPVAGSAVTLRTGGYSLTLDDCTGGIVSFQSGGREWIQKAETPRALFRFCLRDKNTGARRDLTALDARSMEVKASGMSDARQVTLAFRSLGGIAGFDARVTVRAPEAGSLTYWRFTLTNPTGDLLDFIDFPVVVTPDRLRGEGGDEVLFWPGLDGTLVERSDNPMYQPIEYPAKGILGIYPGSCPMQFLAVYGPESGLYAAMLDPRGTPKGIEYRRDPAGGIRLEFRHFPGVAQAARMELPYEIALGSFRGDWLDAAEIYRAWVDASGWLRPPKLEVNPRVPAWLKDRAPVVVTYPVRGTCDSDLKMLPNGYYPYTAALPYLNEIARETESPVLALLMHWEGTAPWAPPYVWPPYGGTTNFLEFVRALHAAGNLAGVYASGVAYTTQSHRDERFNRYAEFANERVFQYVTVAPDGTVATNGACTPDIREGYDLCPANRWVRDRVVAEILKVLPSGVDYFQYFDQNMGGAPCWCYGRTHGHLPVPGPWMTEAMSELYREVQAAADATGRRVLIGTEASASEVYTPYLMLNDTRNFLAFSRGTPVPAYAYVFHEYANNFMGNQCSTEFFLDYPRSPLNYLWRMAYSFCQGDLPTVILGDRGHLLWAWGVAWDEPTRPDRQETLCLARNLNRWRRGAAKPYVVFGRMLKPRKLEGVAMIPLYRLRENEPMRFDALLTTRWEHAGKRAQLIVNGTPSEQTARIVDLPSTARMLTAPSGERREIKNGFICVPALDAVLIEE